MVVVVVGFHFPQKKDVVGGQVWRVALDLVGQGLGQKR